MILTVSPRFFGGHLSSWHIYLPFHWQSLCTLSCIRCSIAWKCFHLDVNVEFISKTEMCLLGAAPSKSVEEEGAVEGIQEWQQPQGLPARRGQLAPLQLVQQVSFKCCIFA